MNPPASRPTSRRWPALLVLVAVLGWPGPAPAQDPPAHDLLNAVLWTQRSVEFQGTARAAFALARIRLDQALADATWTATPHEQTSDFRSLAPAVIVDIDETVLDNSGYQAWMVLSGTTFDPKSWTAFVDTLSSRPIPGAVEFLKYAEARGVKVFYISNRTAQEEESTRKNLEKHGFPLDPVLDTVLTARERPDWGSAKGTRRAHIARSYRVLLNVGDNFGDFVDEFRGSEADRQRVMDEHRDRWGREWIVIANPGYGSFESAPYQHDFKRSEGDKRKAKRAVLEAWPGP
jgi:acid phosphatase